MKNYTISIPHMILSISVFYGRSRRPVKILQKLHDLNKTSSCLGFISILKGSATFVAFAGEAWIDKLFKLNGRGFRTFCIHGKKSFEIWPEQI
jgi:hypothetical protein